MFIHGRNWAIPVSRVHLIDIVQMHKWELRVYYTSNSYKVYSSHESEADAVNALTRLINSLENKDD